MKTRSYIVWVIIFVLVASACQNAAPTAKPTIPATPPVKTSTALSLPSPTPEAPTETPVPIPTKTLSPTETPLPEQSPTPLLPPLASDQEILVSVQVSGDAPSFTEKDYPGYHLPSMILYSDGLLIWREDLDKAFQESVLSTSEICAFLANLQATGVFETQGNGELGADDPIFSGVTWDTFAEGGQSYTITVNGSPSRKVFFGLHNMEYLIPEVAAMFDVIDNFHPAGLIPYVAENYFLYINEGTDMADFYSQDLTAHNWPKEMPKLKELIGDQAERELELTQEQVDLLLPYFDAAPGIEVFSQNERQYSVVLRPLLPNETPGLTIPNRWEVLEYSLPFECENE